MPTHNFYIVNKATKLDQLAEALYGGNGKGFYYCFINLNQIICPKQTVTLGQVLYLPTEGTLYQRDKYEIWDTLRTIDHSTQKLTQGERKLKALNHHRLALGHVANNSIIAAGLIRYRIGKIKELITQYDNDLINITSSSQADSITFELQHTLEMQVRGLINTGLKHSKEYIKKITGSLEIDDNKAVFGLFDSKFNHQYEDLDSWSRIFTKLDRLTKIAKIAGHISIGLDALSHLENIAITAKRYGADTRLGRSVFTNVGQFVGGMVGGMVGYNIGKTLAEKEVFGEITISLLENISIDAAGTAVLILDAPLVATAVGLVTVGVCLHYVGEGAGSVTGWLTGNVAYPLSREIYDHGDSITVNLLEGMHQVL